MQSGRYEALTLWITLFPWLTAALADKIVEVGTKLLHVSFLIDVPPSQVHPA